MPSRDLASRRTPGERAGNLVSVLILTSIIIMSALIARKNLRLDRADRRGAARLAAFTAAALFIVWLIDEHHVPSIWELYLFVLAVGWALFVAALLGTFYLALEPYVRRTWPATIMSWSRVTAGTWRDPLVARDTLIGIAFGGATSVVNVAGCLVVKAVSGQLPRLVTSTRPYLGAVHAVSEFAATVVVSTFLALVFLFILFVMRPVAVVSRGIRRRRTPGGPAVHHHDSGTDLRRARARRPRRDDRGAVHQQPGLRVPAVPSAGRMDGRCRPDRRRRRDRPGRGRVPHRDDGCAPRDHRRARQIDR